MMLRTVFEREKMIKHLILDSFIIPISMNELLEGLYIQQYLCVLYVLYVCCMYRGTIIDRAVSTVTCQICPQISAWVRFVNFTIHQATSARYCCIRAARRGATPCHIRIPCPMSPHTHDWLTMDADSHIIQ